MSEIVQYKGVLKKIDIPLEIKTLEGEVDFLKLKGYSPNYIDFEEEYASFYDCIKIKNIWYSFTKEMYEDNEDIFEATKRKDGSIKYVVKFYNGCCCLEEAITEAVKNVK